MPPMKRYFVKCLIGWGAPLSLGYHRSYTPEGAIYTALEACPLVRAGAFLYDFSAEEQG